MDDIRFSVLPAFGDSRHKDAELCAFVFEQVLFHFQELGIDLHGPSMKKFDDKHIPPKLVVPFLGSMLHSE